MTVQEAEALFDKYFEGKPLFKELIEDSKNLAILNKYTEIPESGFRRLLLDVDSNDTSKRNEALRQALNTQIQGFSAYLMQKALIKMNTYFQENNVDAKIIVSVHDSVAISTRKELVDEVGALCKGFMETLDMDILNVTIDGKPTYFTMEADFGVAINYNNECPYVKEEFENVVSAEGYCSYYTAEEHIGNLADVGLITAEQKEQMLSVHEAWKPYYMNAETLQSNADLYAYHDYTMRYRGVEGILEGV